MYLPGPPDRAFTRYLSAILDYAQQHFIVMERDGGPYGLAHDTDLAQVLHPEWVPRSIQQYAGDVNGFLFGWQTPPEQPYAEGRMHLYALQEMHQPNWKGMFYFDSMSLAEYQRMSTFKPVDFFAGEACVGLFHDERADPELFLYTFEDEPAALGLDIGGYLQLLTKSLGFHYWQVLLVELARSNSPRPYHPARDVNLSPAILEFVDTMPRLMPDWTLDAFVALYDQVRLPREPTVADNK